MKQEKDIKTKSEKFIEVFILGGTVFTSSILLLPILGVTTVTAFTLSCGLGIGSLFVKPFIDNRKQHKEVEKQEAKFAELNKAINVVKEKKKRLFKLLDKKETFNINNSWDNIYNNMAQENVVNKKVSVETNALVKESIRLVDENNIEFEIDYTINGLGNYNPILLRNINNVLREYIKLTSDEQELIEYMNKWLSLNIKGSYITFDVFKPIFEDDLTNIESITEEEIVDNQNVSNKEEAEVDVTCEEEVNYIENNKIEENAELAETKALKNYILNITADELIAELENRKKIMDNSRNYILENTKTINKDNNLSNNKQKGVKVKVYKVKR